MKVKFYLLPIILFLNFSLAAQNCASINIGYSTLESRCVATGSITINATGGSGNFNYQAIGPISTMVTSTPVITGLPGGVYTIRVIDVTLNCISEVQNVVVAGTYSDPRFQLSKTDGTCAGNDGTISAINVQYGRAPFTYTIIAPSPSAIGTTNTTGNFSGLTPGEYYVRLQDSCGGIQVRAVTIENYSWWIDQMSVTRFGCDSADVSIDLEDNKGNTNSSVITFSGFTYGVVVNPGDTTWFSEHEFRIYIGTRRSVTIVVKDGCGNIKTSAWHLPANQKPSLGNPSLTNLVCAGFNASVTGLNLTNPEFCLYDNSNVLISCNTTGVFNNLAYGSYCIRATDLCYDTVITRCFSAARAVPSIGATVNLSNQNCSTFTATVTNKQNLTSASFCLYDNADALLECNTTGIFTNVPYGNYCIKVLDGCVDTLITRCFSSARPVATLTNYTITGSNCDGFNVSVNGNNLNDPVYCLFDNLGNVITCNSTGIFTGLDHGNYCIRAISCGDTTNNLCFGSSMPVPAVATNVQISNRQCSTFTATVTGQVNLTNPSFCIFDASDNLIVCNTNGVFDDLPYGSYCIKIINTCYDTTITRCFTQAPLVPSVNATMQLLSSNCTSVSIRATGTNLSSPTYNLYDAGDILIATNTTGTFNNYPYGAYCIEVVDGCYDTTMRVCRSFAPVRGVSLTTSKSCTIGTAYVDVLFANGNSPYTIDVFHPDGSLVHTATTSSNPLRIQLASLPLGTQYKVVGTDNCGNRDSAMITPDANIVSTAVSVRSKCPSASWLNGAGDLLASCSSNYHAVTPRIIKKNNVNFIKNHSSVTAGVYTFADLEPASYIMEYTQTTCNGKLYDTVTIPPYAYPSQGQSAIYQCDNNSFSLGADVQGGVSPYSFQIIGSMPSSPDITTATQPSPVFNINTGTTYSLVRLRTVDACGNATLSDVSVLPLQNISISATDSCFFRNITLAVDTIPNAIYLWYRKTSPTDSVLLDTSLTYNMPFFLPEQAGEYICKMIVNDGCVTRLSYFSLDGACNEVLPVSSQLLGRRNGTSNQLSWRGRDEDGIVKYVVERKGSNDQGFIPIGSVTAGQTNNYMFNDHKPARGENQYRLKMFYAQGFEYSNVVTLRSGASSIHVYPNPVTSRMQVSITGDKTTDYQVQLVNSSGQEIFNTKLKQVQSTVF
ncbi:MAG: hypothetical protein ACXWV0_05185, partial [Flavisolibacter sp.]